MEFNNNSDCLALLLRNMTLSCEEMNILTDKLMKEEKNDDYSELLFDIKSLLVDISSLSAVISSLQDHEKECSAYFEAEMCKSLTMLETLSGL